ncbi:MAG: phage holin family protein [Eubacterium sp.]|nr:phage holin family protein [Eubacterium sp.]
MSKWQAFIDGTAAVLGAVLGFLFGEAGGLLYMLVAFMAMDYVTGVIAAAVNREISSKAGFKGLAKKLLILVFTAMGHIIDSFALGGTPTLMSAVMLFYIANEGISITENAAILGLPIPKKLKEMLSQLKDKGDE